MDIQAEEDFEKKFDLLIWRIRFHDPESKFMARNIFWMS